MKSLLAPNNIKVKDSQTNSKTKGLKAFLLSFLLVVVVSVFAVGCNAKKIFNQPTNVLPAPNVQLLTANTFSGTKDKTSSPYYIFNVPSSNDKNEKLNYTYSGALVTGAIKELEDKPTYFPAIQVWVNGTLEEFRIVKGEAYNAEDKNNTGYYKNLANTKAEEVVTEDYKKLDNPPKSEFLKQSLPYSESHAGQVIYGGYYYYLTNASGVMVNPTRARLFLSYNNNSLHDLRIVFHPTLSGDAKYLQTVQLKALPANDTIFKQSPYGVSCQVTVRKLTFEAVSYNSTSVDFGYLSYDSTRYAFSASTTRNINGTNRIFRLEGYFVDSRVVNVTRHLLPDYHGKKPGDQGVPSDILFEYDFQSWTVGSMADKTTAVTTNNRVATDGTKFKFNLGQIATTQADYSISAKTESDTLYSAWDSDQGDYGYYASDAQPQTFITQNTLSVRASSSTTRKTFFANYARVYNFTMYGRVFDGDKITETSTQMPGLSGAIVRIYNNANKTGVTFNGEAIELFASGNAYEYTEDGTTANHHALVTDTNGEFLITGLSADAYITVSYTTKDFVDYQFVSMQFSQDEKPDVYGRKKIFTDAKDKENISLTGSALPTGSKLVVNVKLESKNGLIGQDDNIRYEVAQGLTGPIEWFNADGSPCGITDGDHSTHGTCTAYTTTTVLVSVIASNNSMVTGYELSTNVNNQSAQLTNVHFIKQATILTEKDGKKVEPYVPISDKPNDATSLYFFRTGTNASTKKATYVAYWCSDAQYNADARNGKEDNQILTTYDFGSVGKLQLIKNLISGEDSSLFYIGDNKLPSVKKECIAPIVYFAGKNDVVVPNMDELNEKDTTIYYGEMAAGKDMYSYDITSASRSTIKATVYKTDMRYQEKDNSENVTTDKPVHVYYSLKRASFQNGSDTLSRLFYIDPVAHTNNEGNVVWHAFSGSNVLISNGNELIGNQTIMLGANINAAIANETASPALIAFVSCLTAVREDYYYYVKPINPALYAGEGSSGDAVYVYIRNEQVEEQLKIKDEPIYKATDLIVRPNEPKNDQDFNKVYYIYNEDTPELRSNGVAKSNGNLYYVNYVATLLVGEESSTLFFDNENMYLAHNDYKYYNKANEEVTLNSPDLAYIATADGKKVLVSGEYIKENTSEFTDFVSAAGTVGSLSENKAVFYYVVPLVKAANEFNSNLTYNKTTQYYYAFYANKGSSTDYTTLPRSANMDTCVILGKVFSSSKGFVTYSNLLANGNTTAVYVDMSDFSDKLSMLGVKVDNVSIGQKPVYPIDQTLSSTETQGFLGATYLSGTPYPNPVFKFTVRHAADSSSVDLSVYIDQIFYVEALGTLVKRETSDTIIDFSAFTFRDSQTNIDSSASKYINKQTTVLTKNGRYVVGLPYLNNYNDTQNVLRFFSLPVQDFATYYEDDNIYYLGSNPIVLAYCASEKTPSKGYQFYTELVVSGVNVNGSTVNNISVAFDIKTGTWTIGNATISSGLIDKNSIASSVLAALTATIRPNGVAVTLGAPCKKQDFAIWQTSSSSLEDIAFFDIHTYDKEQLAASGIIDFTSDCLDPCVGLLDLDESDILSSSNNYDKVIIAGLTSMYRVSKTDAQNSNGFYHGLFSGLALQVNPAESATNPYFYLSSDAVAMVAEPTYQVTAHGQGDVTGNIRYRFKEWQVYRRFNSDVLMRYQNDDLLTHSTSPIMYFYTDAPGYYLFLPVYERVYELSFSSITEDGKINAGGTGSIVDVTDGLNYKTGSVTVTEANTYFVKPTSLEYSLRANSYVYYRLEEKELRLQVLYVVRDNDGYRFVDENGESVEATIPVTSEDQETIYAKYITFTNQDFNDWLESGIIKKAELTRSYDHYQFTAVWETGQIIQQETKINVSMMYNGQLVAVLTDYFAIDQYGKAYECKREGNNLVIKVSQNNSTQSVVVGQFFQKDFYYYTLNNDIKANNVSTNRQDMLSPTSWLLDRHSGVTIVANSNNGYRLDGFKVTMFDETTGTYITSTYPVESSTATYYDQIKVPTNILLMESTNNGTKFYRVSFSYENGLFSLQKTETTYSSGNYVMYGGRLYYSDVTVEANMVTNLNQFIPVTGVYDDYIEYFYNNENVFITSAENHYVAGNRYQSVVENIAGVIDNVNGNYYVTRVLPTQDAKYAVHYVDLSEKLKNIMASSSVVTGGIAGYQATEAFYDTNGYYYLGQTTHTDNTLIPTKAYAVDSYLDINVDANHKGKYIITLEGVDLKESDNEVALGWDSGKLVTLALYPTSQSTETYEVYRDDQDRPYITRYYLHYSAARYSYEVFNVDESAQTYVVHSYENRTVDNGVVSGDITETLKSLQTVFVDFLVNQVVAADINGKNQQIVWNAVAPTGDNSTHWSVSNIGGIEGFNLEITVKDVQTAPYSFEIVATYNSNTLSFDYTNGLPYTIVLNNEDVTISGITYKPSTTDNPNASLTVATKAASYQLSSTLLYLKDQEKPASDKSTETVFYRDMLSGNILIKNNQLSIKKIDANYFITAQYTQVYQSMNFVEGDSEDELVSVAAMMYFNKTDNTKAIRYAGENKVTSDTPFGLIQLGDSYFSYKDKYLGLDELNEDYTFTTSAVNVYVVGNDGKLALNHSDIVQNIANYSLYLGLNGSTYYDKVLTGNVLNQEDILDNKNNVIGKQINYANGYLKITYSSAKDEEECNYTAQFVDTTNSYFMSDLKNGGYDIKDINGNVGWQVDAKDVANRWHRFDVNTSVILVVRVRRGGSLTTASLGLSNMGNLSFLLCPKEQAIQKQLDVYYYVVRIDFNDQINNQYLADLEHAKREENIKAELSTRMVYKNGSDYYFKKQFTTLESVVNGVITYPTVPVYSYKLAPEKLEYIAYNSIKNTYYYVPSGSLEGLAEGTVWVDGTTDKQPLSVVVWSSTKGVQIDTNATEVLSRLKRASGITPDGKTNIKINSGYNNNYINLTSVEIFTFNVFSVVLKTGTSLSDVSSSLKDGSYINATTNETFDFINFDMYVAGGRFINNNPVTVVGLDQNTKNGTHVIGNNLYTKYLMDATNFNSNLFMNGKLAPLSVCVDTLLAFSKPNTKDGIITSEGKNYRFAGWYQQKKLNDVFENGFKVGENWSELSYMDGSNISHVSISDKDTNIIALYKEVQQVELVYNQNAASFESNYSVDSLGNNWQYERVENGNTKVSGWFDFDASLEIGFTPTSGYRVASFKQQDAAQGLPLSEVLTNKQTFTLLNGVNAGGTYILDTKQVSTVVLELNNFGGNNGKYFDVSLKLEDESVLFSTTWLQLSQDENNNFVYNLLDSFTQSAVKDSTGQYFTFITPDGSANAANFSTLSSTQNTYTVVVQIDIGQKVYVSKNTTAEYDSLTDTQKALIEFDGFYHNKTPLTDNTYILTTTDRMVEQLSATLSTVSNLTITTSVYNSLNSDQKVTATTPRELNDLNISYTNNRYVYNESTNSYIIQPDTNNTYALSGLKAGAALSYSLFFDNGDLSLLWNETDQIFTIDGQKYAFVGFRVNGQLYTSRSFTMSIDFSKTLELVFVRVAKVTISAKVLNNSAASDVGSLSIGTAMVKENILNGTQNYISAVVEDTSDTYIVVGSSVEITASGAFEFVPYKWSANNADLPIYTNSSEPKEVDGLNLMYYTNLELNKIVFIYTDTAQLNIECTFAKAYPID